MKSILVVDDDVNIRALLTQFLEGKDYTVYEASNGHEAAVLQRKHHPDLAIVDIAMPKMGGIETVKKLNNNAPSLDIFLITGKTLEGSKNKLLAKIRKQVDVDKTFTKPLDLDKLLEEVKEYIGTSEVLPEEENSTINQSGSSLSSTILWIISLIIAFVLGYLMAGL